MKLLRADISAGADDCAMVQLGASALRLPSSVLAQRPALAGQFGQSVIVGIRPEDIEDASLHRDASKGCRIRSSLEVVAFSPERMYFFDGQMGSAIR